MHFHADNSQCSLYVERRGILAAVGHDLELRVGEYRVEVSGHDAADRGASALQVRAEFVARSVHVVDALAGRERRPGALSARDKAQIDARIAGEVLNVARYPLITFDSTAVSPEPERYRVRGRLSLTGHTREIELFVLRTGRDLCADFAIHQPDFGIAPYRTFGGALRLAPFVRWIFRAPGAADALRP